MAGLRREAGAFETKAERTEALNGFAADLTPGQIKGLYHSRFIERIDLDREVVVDFDGGKIIGWKDYVNSRTAPHDDNGHGSHCAGIAAGTGTTTAIINGINWMIRRLLARHQLEVDARREMGAPRARRAPATSSWRAPLLVGQRGLP